MLDCPPGCLDSHLFAKVNSAHERYPCHAGLIRLFVIRASCPSGVFSMPAKLTVMVQRAISMELPGLDNVNLIEGRHKNPPRLVFEGGPACFSSLPSLLEIQAFYPPMLSPCFRATFARYSLCCDVSCRISGGRNQGVSNFIDRGRTLCAKLSPMEEEKKSLLLRSEHYASPEMQHFRPLFGLHLGELSTRA